MWESSYFSLGVATWKNIHIKKYNGVKLILTHVVNLCMLGLHKAVFVHESALLSFGWSVVMIFLNCV